MEADGPVGLVLTRQDIPVLAETADGRPRPASRGAPTSWPTPSGVPEIVLVGTGSEVQHCLAAPDDAGRLGRAGAGGVVPVLGPLRAAGRGVPGGVFPPGVPVLSIEAGSTFGWDRYADDAIGIDHFGASAPVAVVMEQFGFTPEHVVERARALLDRDGG